MKRCEVCNAKICDCSTYCRKCSRISLYRTPDIIERNDKILSLYEEGLSTLDVAQIVGLSQSRIQQILGGMTKLTRHKYTFDDGVWGSDTPEKYYLLGLFAVDGTVSKNDGKYKFIEISLKESDRVLLEDIKKVFKTEKPIYVDRDQLKLNIYSDASYDYLCKFGITERKSKTLKILEAIPENRIVHFLRGVFDGDGCITGDKSADITLCVTASKEFATQIIDLYNIIGFDVLCYNSDGKYIIKKCGKDGLKILATLYASGGMFLPRKYEKLQKFARLSLDEVMIDVAHIMAKRSTCIRRKVGCVITNAEKTNIISIGYNGSVAGGANHCESSFPGECGCIHAEENALIKNNNNGKFLYCTTIPCKKCAKLIVNAGIKKVFYDSEYRYSYSLGLFNRSGISCYKINKSSFKWKNEIAEILEWKND